MVSSVFNIAVTGLSTAQAGLSAISNNISNAGTKGYSRQDIVQTASEGLQTRIGYFGNGVNLEDVRRVSSDFLNARLNEALSKENYFNSYADQISQIDSVLSDDANGVAAGLTGFFTAIQDLTTRPGDLATRESVLTAAKTVSGRINGVNTALERVRDSINSSLQGAVDAVNGLTRQLADLNVQITEASNRGGKGATPNDLLDRRDGLLRELSGFVANTVVNNGDNTINIYLKSGQPLVSKTKSAELIPMRDPFDPLTIQVGLRLTSADDSQQRVVRFDANSLGEGKIAGLIASRDTDLTQYRNILGVIAGQFADRINTLQREGFDLNGDAGVDMFAFNASKASRSSNNESNATVSITAVEFSKVKAVDYELLNDAGTLKYRAAYSRDDYREATLVSTGNPSIYTIGQEFTFSIDASTKSGDRFLLQPVTDVAATLQLDLQGASAVAAGRTAGARGDASNLQRMALLQTSTVENTAFGATQEVTVTSAFNQLVSRVGNRGREIQEAAATSTAVREGAEAQQQDVSGVNLDEEAANLLKYQQAYQAAGQVIAMSKDLFDSLLSAIR